MLHRVHIVRLAFNHSPEKERRLLAFSEQRNPLSSTGNAAEAEMLLRNSLLAAETDDQRRLFLSEYHERFLEILKPESQIESMTADGIIDVMEGVRVLVVKEVAEEQRLALKIATNDPITLSNNECEAIVKQYSAIIERYGIEAGTDREVCIKLQALFNETVNKANSDFERLNAKKRNKGPKWTFLPEKDFCDKYGDVTDRIPSSFVQNGTIYFNIDHPSFKEPTSRVATMERVVTHEVMHIAVSEKKEEMNSIAIALEKMPMWNQLKNAVVSLLGADEIKIMSSGGAENTLIVEEALAIYAGEQAVAKSPHVSSEEETQLHQYRRHITETLGTMLGSLPSNELRNTANNLLYLANEYRLTRSWNAETKEFEHVELSNLLKSSVDTSVVQDKLVREMNDSTASFRRNNGPEEAELKGRLSAEEEKMRKELETFESALKSIQECENGISELRSNDETMLQYIQTTFTDAKERAEQLGAFGSIQEELSGYNTDLRDMRRYTEALSQWSSLSVSEKKNVAEMFPMNHYTELDNTSPEAAIRAADDASKKYRKILMETIVSVLSNIKQRVKLQQDIKEKIENHNKSNAKPENAQDSLWGWFKKNVYYAGTSGAIMWVTPLNMMRIFTIFKEAISENYKSNQSLKEYNLAKKLNIYKPIEHTLKKQAKSANEKETGEFKEYIEREGYTFDEIFGDGGKGEVNGLLHENRHNFNRAKAVILYAADHAWLYHMDRFNGHDVYGIDYATMEGNKSFEELVGQYENGKEKEEKHGKEKVDKHPDISYIIKDMREELGKKNIFAVRGMLKRIQDKGKVGEGNAWAAAEIVRVMRNPEIMAVMDKGFLDDVGNIGIGQSAWTLTLFKLMRHSFEDHRRGKLKKLEDKNVFVTVVKKIQDMLEEAGLSIDNDDVDTGMDRMIGKVLAGQTVKLNGRTISIFQNINEFNEYRRYWATTPTSTEPGKTDDDYFSPGNLGSDLLMLPKTSIQAILVRTSQGQWTHGTRAPNYLAQVIFRDNDLGANDPAAQAIFRKEMQQRLSYFFGEASSHTATRENFADDTTPTSGDQPEISDLNILMELWQRHLISEAHFLSLAMGLKEDSSVPNGLKKLRKAKGVLDKAKAASPPDTTKIELAEQAYNLALEQIKTAETKQG